MKLNSNTLRAISILLMIALCAVTACKKNDKDEDVSTATLFTLVTFSDNNNGTVNSPGGFMVAKCSFGQVWLAGLNNCAGTGGGTTYGAQSFAYCAVANGCADTTTYLATSGPAYAACASYSVSGISGWRLPTVAELVGLTTSLNRNTFILMFPQTPDDKDFWSGETNTSKTDGSEAYGVNFASSTFGNKTSVDKVSAIEYVRCVK